MIDEESGKLVVSNGSISRHFSKKPFRYALLAVLIFFGLIVLQSASSPEVQDFDLNLSSLSSAVNESTQRPIVVEDNQEMDSNGCIYVVAFGGLTNKLNIVANGRHLANKGFKVCAYLWEDGADQSLPYSPNKRLSVPPVDIPYLLERPVGCKYFRTKVEYRMTGQVDIPSFDEPCLILDGLLLTSRNTEEESVFDMTLKMPKSIPKVTACIHVRNEPDMNLGVNEEKVKTLIASEESVMVLGDPKYISKEVLDKAHYYHTVSNDATVIMAYCTCKGKKLYGVESSSLSQLICGTTNDCTWLQTTIYMRVYDVEFRRIKINC